MNRVDEDDRESDIHTLESGDESHFRLSALNECGSLAEEFSPHESSVKLFVGSLPYDVDEEDIIDVFTKFGEVFELTILRDRSGRSKGCAALRYTCKEAAELCISTLHNKFCCGNVPTPMQVRYFEKRESQSITCFIEGLPFCFAPNILWASLDSTYGSVSNVYPDAMNPFAMYVSFYRKSSAFSLSADARAGSLCIGGVMCPAAQVTIMKQPLLYPYGYYPSYPGPVFAPPPPPSVVSPTVTGEMSTEDPPVKLFVGCLPYSKTAQDIADLFTPFGDLLEVAILTDYGGKSRGAAFVTFAKTSEAKKAVEALKDFSFPKSTRSINISFAHKQNIWHTQYRTSETGTAPSCTSSLSDETASPTNTEKGLGEAIST